MAVTKTTYTQSGSTTQYTVTFEVIDAADIDVYVDGVLQLQQNTTSTAAADHPQVVSGEITQGTALINYTVASNNGSITFNQAPTVGAFLVIERTTADAAAATFVAGSTIRAQDLNNAFDQVRFLSQEAVYTASENVIRSRDNGDSFDAINQRIQNLADGVNDTDAVNRGQLGKVITDDLIAGEGIDLTDATGGTNSNKQVTVSAEFSTDSNPGIITVDATAPITRTYGANGQLDLSIADGAIDIAKLDPDDIITLAEQNAGPTVNDTSWFTSSAAAKRFDTIVQTTTPTGTDYEIGKTWLQNDEDKTVSMWNGSAWVPVASGGAFTELGKVVYVDAVNGDDSLAGHRISNPKRTIKAAMDQINAETDAVGNGSMILVAPGIYAEEFPITIQKNDVSIVGTSLRNCIIHPAIGVTAATAAVNGSEYRIRFVGTTDFTAIGAPDNVVGTVFTATGAGTGTGTLEDTAVQAAYDVDVPEANELSTMFQVNSGTYIQNLTLQGMKGNGTRGGNVLDTDATFGLPTQQGWNFAFFPGATIRKSPYIQNCTNFSDSQINNVNFTPHVPGEGAAGDLDSGGFSGGGILIDGDTVAANSPLRSMVCDSYTHTALNGPGIFVTNNGYTQVTSSYAFFTHYHLKCLNGGQANLAASTSDFGRYSLVADGRSTTNIFTADLTVNAADQATTFTIGQPTADASWHGNATRPQPNMLVQLNGITYPILSSVANGLGWDVTISRPDPANRSNNLGLNGAVNAPATAQFFLRSQIASSGHTMEYVGSGTDYRALPENATGTFPVGANDPVTADATAGNAPCGVPVEDRQTIVLNDGAIWTAITDHNGKFRVGGDQVNDATYEVDQQLGRVTFRTGSLSFPNLIQNLDTNGFNIFDSTGHVNINDELDVNSNKIVNLAAPTADSDAATKLYVDSQVSVADKIEEGNSSVEVVDTGTNGTIVFTNDATESARIDSGRRLLVGTSSAANTSEGFNPSLQIASTGAGSSASIARFSTTTTHSPRFTFKKSASGTLNTNSLVSSTDVLGGITFEGSTATSWLRGAQIQAVVDGGTPGSASMPGRLVFSTTADGATTPTERMRIDSNGLTKFSSKSGSTSSPDTISMGSSYSSTAGTNTKIRTYDDGSGNYNGIGHSASTFDISAGINGHKIAFYTNSGSGATERMQIDKDGHVGIGTTNPAYELVVASSGTSSLQILAGGSTNQSRLMFADANDIGIGRIYYDHNDNSMLLATNNSERARIDSSGRLLVGTTSSTGNALFVVQGLAGNSTEQGVLALRRSANNGTNNKIGVIEFADSSNNQAALIEAVGDGTWGTNDYPGRLVFSTTTDGRGGPTERMRIRYNGQYAAENLGNDTQILINTTSSSFNENFKVQSYASSTSGTNYGSVFDLNDAGYKPSNTSYNLYVNTVGFGARTGIYSQTNSGWNDTNIAVHGKSGGGQYSQGIGVLAEIQHSDANGPGWQPALYAKGVSATNGTSGGAGCAVFHLVNSQPAANPMNKCIDEYNGSNTRQWFTFTRNGSQIGSISHTTSSTSYNTSSDYRLKENVVTLTGEDAESRLRQLPVKRFNFISEPGKTVDGFLAHEVSPYVPEAVTGEKDGMKTEPVYDETGKMILEDDKPVMQTIPEYQEIDQAKLVPLLTAALQKAFDKIDALEARIATLETP